MSARFPTTHCDDNAPHQAHMVTTTKTAGYCPGYPAPAPQQVWRDADPRLALEQIVRCRVIVRTDETHAHCHASDETGAPIGSRIFKVRLDRFKPNSTGYRYVGMAR